MKSVFSSESYHDKNINNEIFKKAYVDEKLTSQSKKEMENFIQAKLRIITWEQPLSKLFCPLEIKAQLYKFSRQEAAALNAV